MGLSVLCLNVGHVDKLQARGELPGKMAVIITLLVISLFAEMTDAISDFRTNSLTIQSNEEFFRTKVKIDGTRRRKVRLHLPGINMNQHLNDRSSSQYKTLSKSLSRDIQRLFANTAGKQRVSNIRFSKFTKHKEHGSLNEAGSVQRELPFTTSLPRPKPLPFATSTSAMSAKRSTQRSNRAFLLSRSTVTVATPSRRRWRGPPNETMTTANSLSAQDSSIIVTTASRAVEHTVATATSVQTTAVTWASTTANQKVFDTLLITRMFKECFARAPNGDYVVPLEKYLDAYTELLSIFNLLGPIFSFAGDAVKEKLTQLRELRRRDIEQSQNNYVTFQSMFAYEYSPQGASAEHEGTSTNIWIHRGLKFIAELIKVSLAGGSDKSLGDHAQELYTAILAPYHPWYVRTVAYLALLSFPTRSHLLGLMGITDKAEDLQALADLSSAIEAVYDDVEHLYVKYST
ncbi:hypothetical protein BsWGS_26499 [Bradybaena similaris]